MRIPSPFRDRRSSVELQLTPMIDCVFLLMVYFIWSSSFVVAELTLTSRLSAQAGSSSEASADVPPPEADFDEVIIRILWAGDGPAWAVNDAPIGSLAELRRLLETIARIKRDAPVILDASGNVPLGDVIDVFDLSRLAGFEKIRFATSALAE
jgi:biopolymer transport protein ExbD